MSYPVSLYALRDVALADPAMRSGYSIALEICAAICRSHIASAERKFGPASEGVRIGRADLCCIDREQRRVAVLVKAAALESGA